MLTPLPAFEGFNHLYLIIAMTSETESNAPSTLASDTAISIGTEDTQSQIELPEHDEHSIYHCDKTYKRGKARPAKRRNNSSIAWYWSHGEEISENGRKRWMCEPCWEAKKFTHYTQNSNKAIANHLKMRTISLKTALLA